MDPVRKARLESEIRDQLSFLISRELKDPRIPSITITTVTLTSDASLGTILITILGGTHGIIADEVKLTDKQAEVRMKRCLEGLKSATPFLKRQIAKAIQMRKIPDLIFKEDKGFENVHRVSELLKQISIPEPAKDSNDGQE